MSDPVTGPPPRREVPRLDDDYTAAAARRRMAFLAGATGTSPEHIGRYSFDPAVVAGNVENFIGAALRGPRPGRSSRSSSHRLFPPGLSRDAAGRSGLKSLPPRAVSP
jgi:hypothetical protein